MTKHTPDEWPCACGHPLYQHDDGEGACGICETCQKLQPVALDFGEERTPLEKAAPDLAEALEALIGLTEDSCPTPQERMAFAEARAALRKAGRL